MSTTALGEDAKIGIANAKNRFSDEINAAIVAIGVLFGQHLRGDQTKTADTQQELVSIQYTMAVIVMAGDSCKMKFLFAL